MRYFQPPLGVAGLRMTARAMFSGVSGIESGIVCVTGRPRVGFTVVDFFMLRPQVGPILVHPSRIEEQRGQRIAYYLPAIYGYRLPVSADTC